MASMKDLAIDLETVRAALANKPHAAIEAFNNIERVLESLMTPDASDDALEMVKARDLEPGDLIDLEPAFRANPEGDEVQELADGVHWSLYEMTVVERVETVAGETTIEHDYGVMIVDADTLLPRIGA